MVDVCASVTIDIVPTLFCVLGVPFGNHPYGKIPTGENRATTLIVTMPVPALTKYGAATSSVFASIPGSVVGFIDVLGFQLFCACPTLRT